MFNINVSGSECKMYDKYAGCRQNWASPSASTRGRRNTIDVFSLRYSISHFLPLLAALLLFFLWFFFWPGCWDGLFCTSSVWVAARLWRSSTAAKFSRRRPRCCSMGNCWYVSTVLKIHCHCRNSNARAQCILSTHWVTIYLKYWMWFRALENKSCLMDRWLNEKWKHFSPFIPKNCSFQVIYNIYIYIYMSTKADRIDISTLLQVIKFLLSLSPPFSRLLAISLSFFVHYNFVCRDVRWRSAAWNKFRSHPLLPV